MKIPLTFHAKFRPTAVLVDHDEENHQQDAGKSSKPDSDGYLGGDKTVRAVADHLRTLQSHR